VDAGGGWGGGGSLLPGHLAIKCFLSYLCPFLFCLYRDGRIWGRGGGPS